MYTNIIRHFTHYRYGRYNSSHLKCKHFTPYPPLLPPQCHLYWHCRRLQPASLLTSHGDCSSHLFPTPVLVSRAGKVFSMAATCLGAALASHRFTLIFIRGKTLLLFAVDHHASCTPRQVHHQNQRSPIQ